MRPLEETLTVSQKFNIGLSWPKIPTLGMNSRETLRENMFTQNVYTNVHDNIIHNSQKLKHAKCPSINEWINKSDMCI